MTGARFSWRRAVALALVAAVALAASGGVVASAYEGSSLFENIVPANNVHGLQERYPLNRYGLDFHIGNMGVDHPSVHLPGSGGLLNSIVNSAPTGLKAEGVPYYIADVVADGIFFLHRLLSSFVLTILGFVYSLHLIETVIHPVLDAMHRLYVLLGGDLFTSVICLVGVWAVLRVIRGRVASTVAQLGVSVVCILTAMFIITQSWWVIPRVANGVVELSAAMPAAVSGGSGKDAQTAMINGLFKLQVREPWKVLNFGGTVLCTDEHYKPVAPMSSQCVDSHKINTDKYADLWLMAGGPNGKERNLLFSAVKDGKKPNQDEIENVDLPPDASKALADLQLSYADKPSVDVQQQEMAVERLGVAILVFIAGMGINLLIGGCAIMMITSAVQVLLELLWSSAMLLIGAVPNAGHRVFRDWISRIAFGLAKPLVYSLLLSALIAINMSLTDAASSLNWLVSEALVTLFAWGIFLKRHELYRRFITAIGGGVGQHDKGFRQHAQDIYWGSRAARPVVSLATAAAGGVVGGGERVGRGGTRLGRHTRDGANAYTAGAFTSEQMVTAGTVRDAAMRDLERGHTRNVERVRQEKARRAREEQLRQRQAERAKMTPDQRLDAIGKNGDPIASPQQEKRDREELARLEKRAMPAAEYKGLQESVGRVEQHERDTGSRFSTDEISAQVARCRQAAQATEDPAAVAERARQWATKGHDLVFGDLVIDTSGGEERSRGGKPSRDSAYVNEGIVGDFTAGTVNVGKNASDATTNRGIVGDVNTPARKPSTPPKSKE
jgi:hypothetical protein